MEKVKLIKIEEVEIYPGQTTLELDPPLESLTDSFVSMNGDSINEMTVEREHVPINLFIYVDGIPVRERELNEKSIDQLLADGYTVSSERDEYVKEFKYKTAMTTEARKFLDMEKEAIKDLKMQIRSLNNEIITLEKMKRTEQSYSGHLERKIEKMWTTRIKKFFKKLFIKS